MCNVLSHLWQFIMIRVAILPQVGLTPLPLTCAQNIESTVTSLRKYMTAHALCESCCEIVTTDMPTQLRCTSSVCQRWKQMWYFFFFTQQYYKILNSHCMTGQKKVAPVSHMCFKVVWRDQETVERSARCSHCWKTWDITKCQGFLFLFSCFTQTHGWIIADSLVWCISTNPSVSLL